MADFLNSCNGLSIIPPNSSHKNFKVTMRTILAQKDPCQEKSFHKNLKNGVESTPSFIFR